MAKKTKEQWKPVDLRKEGMEQAAAYSGVSEMLAHASGEYTLALKMDAIWKGGARRHVRRWHLRKGLEEVYEVLPQADLDAAKREAEAYINGTGIYAPPEPEQPEDVLTERPEQPEPELPEDEQPEQPEQPEDAQLPGGMTEEQFDDIYNDEEDDEDA